MVKLSANRPHVVGYDVSGVVVKCGVDVKKFKVGDAVFGMLPHDCNGALAEYVCRQFGHQSMASKHLTLVLLLSTSSLVGVHEDYIALKPTNLTYTHRPPQQFILFVSSGLRY